VLFDLTARTGRLLMGRPGPDQPAAQHLWDALHEHYATELKPATAVTRHDWPRLDQEWRDFVRAREAQANVGATGQSRAHDAQIVTMAEH
jgi:hypothetical protein